jgi:predicted permease
MRRPGGSEVTGRLVGFCNDVRYALRGLKNAPGYAVTMVVTLALGLGAVTAMLAVVDSVLLRPVRLPHPEELVMISGGHVHAGPTFLLSFAQVEEIRRETRLFREVSGYRSEPAPVGTKDGTRMAVMVEATPNLFEMLGVQARHGRVMTAGDAEAPVAVINAAFARERMHAMEHAVGSTIKVLGQSRTVIGVLPDGMHFPQGVQAPMVYVPMSLRKGAQSGVFDDAAMVLARLKPEVTRQQAIEELRSLFLHQAGTRDPNPQVPEVHFYSDYLTGDLRTGLLALLGGCTVLLLIACANAANLQIVRAAGRIMELHVRAALGASRTRLLQQAMTESVVVSLVGAALGGGIAYLLVRMARTAFAARYSRFEELTVHPLILGACALLALGAGALASIAPLPQIRKASAASAMRATRATRPSRVPGLLVMVQVGLTCVLLVVSTLFVKTLRALEDVPLGFDPQNVTTVVLMQQNQHQDPELTRQTVGKLLDAFAALPGVEAATMQSAVPFSSFNMGLNGATDVSGREHREGDSASYSLVSSNFVHASGLRLIRGRDFLPRDDGSGAIVALVNQEFVGRFFGNRDPIGATVKFSRGPHDTDADMPFLQPMNVVGVVQNEMQGGDLGAPFEPMVYLDYRQLPNGSMFVQLFNLTSEFAVRSRLPQQALDAELRGALQRTAPGMAEMSMTSMEESIASSLSERRLTLRLVSSFGAVALLLAAIGIYGVLSYTVMQRRKEIGIRMALGSSRSGATKLVVRQAGMMVLLGVAIGFAAAWPAGRALRSFLFGVGALDPWAFSVTAGVLLVVGMIAAMAPAWRAARVNPMEVLRAE